MRNSTKKARDRVINNNKILRVELMHKKQLATFLRLRGHDISTLSLEEDIKSIEQLLGINERTIKRLGKLL